jgi:putative transcriptional regulator
MAGLAGKLLIAPPTIKGTFWTKSVIYITEDHYNGTVGITLNKPSKMSLREFGDQCSVDLDLDGSIYVGGPANTKALTMLHSSEWFCKNTLRVNKQFSLSSSDDLLDRLALGDVPYHWRLFVGLSTWAPDQLECEIKGKHPFNHNQSWLIATPDHHTVFGLDGQDQWITAIEQSSLEFSQNILA